MKRIFLLFLICLLLVGCKGKEVEPVEEEIDYENLYISFLRDNGSYYDAQDFEHSIDSVVDSKDIMYTFYDLANDNIIDMIVRIGSEEYSYLILHYEDKMYGFYFEYPSIVDIKSDGSMSTLSSSDDFRIVVIDKISKNTYSEKVLASNNEKISIIDNKEVSERDFNIYYNGFIKKTDLKWDSLVDDVDKE